MEATEQRPQMRLYIFAYHVFQIASTTAPAEFTLHPCDGVSAKVTIEPSPNGHEWDAVTINSKSCGNRHGGIKAFTEMVQAVNPVAIYDSESSK